MQLVALNQQPSQLKFEPTYYYQRKTETMFLKFLKKFFWMKGQNHRHSVHHLSDHLKRDIGFMQRDVKPKRGKNPIPASLNPPITWL